MHTIERFPQLVLPAMLLCLFWTGKAPVENCDAFGANSLIKSWCISVTHRRYRSVCVKSTFNKIHPMSLWRSSPRHFQTLIDSTRAVIQPPRVTWFPGSAASLLRPAGWQIERQEVPLSVNQLKCVRKYIWHDLQKCQVWRWQDSQSVPGSLSTPKFQSAR